MSGFEIQIKEPIRKDMQKVYDYEARTQLRIFRGQCFNNACVLMQGSKVNINNTQSITEIYVLATLLYQEGIKNNWLKPKEEE